MGSRMEDLLSELVCATMKKPSIPARRPSAGARPGRCVSFVAVGTHRPLFVYTLLRFVLLDPEQLLCFRPEAAEFFILWRVLLHPLDGLVVPLAGVILVAELPVGHGEEERVEGAIVLQFGRVLESLD